MYKINKIFIKILITFSLMIIELFFIPFEFHKKSIIFKKCSMKINLNFLKWTIKKEIYKLRKFYFMYNYKYHEILLRLKLIRLLITLLDS